MTLQQPLTFFWHDYETFGRVPRSDRPSQFAGVRTDAQLQQIEEPVVLYCKPAEDFLPDPEACLLTGITPEVAEQHGVPEPEFATRILQKLAAAGTVGVGYNSLRFDDEVTRFLLWRNLLDPYAREWQNDCGRWDLLDVIRCCFALRPQTLQWPKHDDGRASFKLEHLSVANGIEHADAHDAMADVRATLELARRIRSAVPKLWDFALKLRRKQAVMDEISAAQVRGEPLIHVSGMYPAERGCMALVWPLAPHPINRNELIVWDLAHDPTVLRSLNASTLRERMYAKADAGVERLPIKTIHLNRSPMVVSSLKTLDAARAQALGIDVDVARRHASLAAHDVPMLAGLWPEVFAPQAHPARDADEDLYGGLVQDADRRRLQQLRARADADWAARLPDFDDERLDEVAFRYRARNHPASLDDDDQERWAMHRIARLVDGEGGARTLEAFMAQLDALQEDPAVLVRADAQAVLSSLRRWAERVTP
jgi:exodeoxyribonuclease I